MIEYRGSVTGASQRKTEVIVEVETDLPSNPQAKAIVQFHLPMALIQFIEKNADYGDAAVHLGARGQFADMNRKYWKLKAALWDGKELHGESVVEVLRDLIGHCLLTLHFLAENGTPDLTIPGDDGGAHWTDR